MSKLAASLIIRCARPDGLARVIECASRQDYDKPWELVVVDWAHGERADLLEWIWKKIRPDIPLVHVPPLPPLTNRPDYPGYHAWDIGLSFNTGWAHASGEVCVHIEDYWVFKEDWFRTHAEFALEHPNLVTVGEKIGEPVWDLNAITHYNHKRSLELQQLISDNVPAVLDMVKDPRMRENHTNGFHGELILVNFSHALAPFVENGGLPEFPTRWPETHMAIAMSEMLLSMWALPGVPAWHYNHPGGRIIGNVMRIDATGGLCVYEPVKIQSAYEIPQISEEIYRKHRRNLKDERRRLGHWV